jgi:WD40 repeat protein
MTHLAPVVYVALSRDGKTALTVSADGWTRLWDASTGKPRPEQAAKLGEMSAAAIGPDSETILVYSPDGSVDPINRIRNKVFARPLQMPYLIQEATLSPDARLLLVRARAASTGATDELRLLSAATGKPFAAHAKHKQPFHIVSFSPDGRHVFAAGNGRTASLWDTASERSIWQHESEVLAAVFSADGKTLLVGCKDLTARVLNAATGNCWEPPSFIVVPCVPWPSAGTARRC